VGPRGKGRGERRLRRGIPCQNTLVNSKLASLETSLSRNRMKLEAFWFQKFGAIFKNVGSAPQIFQATITEQLP
jgi:hypothetical protein